MSPNSLSHTSLICPADRMFNAYKERRTKRCTTSGEGEVHEVDDQSTPSHYRNRQTQKTMQATRLLIFGQFLIIAPLLISGCSKMNAEEAEIRQDFSSIPSDMPIEILGEVEFVSGFPRKIELNDGQSLTITATTQPDDTIQISLEYESARQSVGRLVTESYSEQSQFLLRPGMRCAPKLGDELAIVFRPRMVGSDADTLP